MTISYITIYLSIVILLFLFNNIWQRKVFSKLRPVLNILIVITIMFVLGFRYDTTTDYDNYIRFFLDLQKGVEGRFEPGYLILNNIFSGVEYGYIYVFLICSVFSIYVLYKFFKEHDILIYGFMFFFLLGIFKDYDNLIRQSVSISFFILGINSVLHGRFIKFIILGLAASLFHFSALFLFPLFYFLIWFFRKYDINFVSWLIIILITYLSYILGFFRFFSSFILKSIPTYSHYAMHEKLGVVAQLSTGLGILFWVLIGIFLAYFKNNLNPEKRLYVNLGIISIVLFFVVNDYLILERAVKYFHVFRIVALVYVISSIRAKLIRSIVILASLLFFIKSTFSYYGSNPYRTIFCEKRKEWKVYDRKRLKTEFSPTSYREEYIKLKK